MQLGIGDLFSDSALPDLYIPNPQLDILYPIGDLRFSIEDTISDEHEYSNIRIF